MENPAPPPAPSLYSESRSTPKDFFLWFGAILALYASVTSFITLLFEYINYTYPDVLAGYSNPYDGVVRAAMATVIVLVPTTIVLFRIIRKNNERDPLKLHTWVRKWALVLTVFIASVTILIDLITLITTFLGGEITTRFALKALVILLVAIGIFLHFFADMKGYWSLQPKRASIIGIAFGVVSALVVIAGFIIIGTPSHARLIRFDEQKVTDLQNIQYQITDYYQQKRELPESITDLNDPLTGYQVPIDAQGTTEYEYTRTSTTGFTICATFNAQSTDAPSTNYYGSVMDQNLVHGAGRQCFTRTIDPERYPPAPKVQ